jgi:Sec-independent protein translocase protein TatA
MQPQRWLLLLCAACLTPTSHAFAVVTGRAAVLVRPARPPVPTLARSSAHNGCGIAAAPSKRAPTARMLGGGGFNGGFLNLGAPEVIVIGAVAWAILGPKELFKLAKQAGEFIGEWQSLGMQAKNQFTSALESELAEEESGTAATEGWGAEDAGPSPLPADWREATSPEGEPYYYNTVTKESTWERPSSAPTYAESMAETAKAMEEMVTGGGAAAAASSSASATTTIRPPAEAKAAKAARAAAGAPTLEEFAAARASEEAQQKGAAGEPLTAEEEEALRASMIAELGEPTESRRNFEEQLSGARNRAVLDEYPSELSMPEGPADGSDLDVQVADEALLETQISQTENELETLRAEKRILSLKRKQLEQNAERAKRMAAERAAGGDAVREEGGTPQEGVPAADE